MKKLFLIMFVFVFLLGGDYSSYSARSNGSFRELHIDTAWVGYAVIDSVTIDGSNIQDQIDSLSTAVTDSVSQHRNELEIFWNIITEE